LLFATNTAKAQPQFTVTLEYEIFQSDRYIYITGVSHNGNANYAFGRTELVKHQTAHLQNLSDFIKIALNNSTYRGRFGYTDPYIVTTPGKLVLGDSIATIGSTSNEGDGIFEDCLWLTELEITSNTFATIGDRAFAGCANLKSVTLNSALNSIGGRAFAECTSLESINLQLHSSAFTIRHRAFIGCTNLKTVTLPSN
jgi:hypothetical protein